ncbi:SDR family NAD(P)-dependent oxidoreductase [Calothrix sp. 336/3]|uniref:SDR family NAD(P)-dependent oxidoreductase n=1 Tax=Calothrix sp. 336/3 TaxID=1337936 RepID=UPI0004E2C03D|nr:SDR family NAD(P)-dependent oxidoreductase [Calothrix sp. 336/3]AKG23072.1 polyketide synthase [Calothrix sp. 336/3]
MTTKTAITPASVLVVSGGAKGITAKCTIKLAQQYPCKFILLGRSKFSTDEPEFARNCDDEAALKKRIMEYLQATGEKPTPMSVKAIYNQISSSREIQATLTAIHQAGGQAEYLNADVTNLQELQQKLTQATAKLGRITGIIHGAGNLADKLIEKKTEEDFEKVYTAKVQGLENLLNCIPPHQLEHLILFSSVTGFYGNIGQADYAIANEILNKSAHLFKQQHPHCHVVAINWGGWDSGMVTPQLKKEFARRGIDIIPVESGTQMLVNEVHPTYHDTTQVVIGSPLKLPPLPPETELKNYRIRRKLTLENNPFLFDHVIAGNPVLPATCAVSWMSDVCEKLYPGYKAFSSTDFRILKGITFNETLAPEYILDIQEVAINVDNYELDLSCKIWSQTPEGKTVYHFSTQIKLLKDIPPAPIYPRLNLTPDNIITKTGKELYQTSDDALFHGAAFQQIRRVINITPEKITTECIWEGIDKKIQGQYPTFWVNGFTTDLSTHGLWIWLNHFHQEICLPGQSSKYEQFARTPINTPFYVSCEVTQKTPATAAADFYVHDEKGKIYSQFIGTKGIIIPTKMMKAKK